MIYEALFIVCSLNPLNLWVGDQDSGPTCVIEEKASFETIEQCSSKLGDTLQHVRTQEQQEILATRIPSPYSYKMFCTATVGVGVLDCVDCNK